MIKKLRNVAFATGLVGRLLCVSDAAAVQPLTFAPKPTPASSANVADALQLFGEGAIQSYARGDSSQGSPATGSIGIQLLKPAKNERWTAAVTVASTVDTVDSGFGAVLLTAGAGVGFQSGFLDVQREYDEGWRSGFLTRKLHAYATTARVRFALDSVGVREAVVVGLGVSRCASIGNGKIAENPFSLTVEAGLAWRALAGNIGGKDNRDLRRELLGTAGRVFWGPDLGMQITFRDIAASIHYYQLFDASERARVEGLTTGQVIASISIRGTILSGALN